MKEARPKIMFDDPACDSQACDDCPPANTDVLESDVTCSQLLKGIWRIQGENEEFRRKID